MVQWFDFIQSECSALPARYVSERLIRPFLSTFHQRLSVKLVNRHSRVFHPSLLTTGTFRIILIQLSLAVGCRLALMRI